MLKVEKINVFYGQLQALWNLSIEVMDGEIVAVVGSNGAGKTTLLRTISGLHKPKSGIITFNGQRIDKIPPEKIVKLGVVHIPEGKRAFPYLTVMENLLLGAYNNKARKHIKETLEWVFSLFPILEERKNQLACTLSGGEQQMLAIGRGLMSRPKLLMLDEPTWGLAPKLVALVFNIIEKLNKEGVTFLIVEQNVTGVLQIAHRGYVIETGRISYSGRGGELLENENIKKKILGVKL